MNNTKQRGEFEATVKLTTFPSNPNQQYRIGEVRRPGKPRICGTSWTKESKTEEEVREDLKRVREKSLKEDNDIEKRERNAREADNQLRYYEDRYGKDSNNRPKHID